jgi:hypothetical protein
MTGPLPGSIMLDKVIGNFTDFRLKPRKPWVFPGLPPVPMVTTQSKPGDSANPAAIRRRVRRISNVGPGDGTTTE